MIADLYLFLKVNGLLKIVQLKRLSNYIIGLFLLILAVSCRSNIKEEAIIIDNIEIQDSLVLNQLRANVKNHPSVAVNYALLADRYIEQNKYNEAIKTLRIGVQKVDNASDLYADLARAYLGRDDPENAREYIDDLDIPHSGPEYNYLLSLFEYEMEHYTVAFDLINKALALDNANALYYQQKGKSLLALQDTATAISVMEKGINCENARIDNFNLLIDVLIKRDELQKAEDMLKLAINKYPENNQLHFNYARFLEKMEKINAAKQKYLNLTNTDLFFSVNERLMSIYLKERKYDSLDMIINQTLERDDQNIDALLYSARVEDRFRRYQNAVDLYQKILSIDTTQTIAAEELDNLQRKMRYLRRLKQKEKEREESRKIKPLNPI